MSEEKFNELNNILKKVNFLTTLLSKDLKFKEVFKYITYLNEKLDHITMHKTKGSSIESVLVVLDEYFWSSEYNFKSIYDGTSIDDLRRIKSQKIVLRSMFQSKKKLALCSYSRERIRKNVSGKVPICPVKVMYM